MKVYIGLRQMETYERMLKAKVAHVVREDRVWRAERGGRSIGVRSASYCISLRDSNSKSDQCKFYATGLGQMQLAIEEGSYARRGT